MDKTVKRLHVVEFRYPPPPNTQLLRYQDGGEIVII